MLSRPVAMSASRFRVPSARLGAPGLDGFTQGTGFDINMRVGLIASTNWRRWKLTRCRSSSSMSAASPCSSSQSEARRYSSFRAGRRGLRAIQVRRTVCHPRARLVPRLDEPEEAEPALSASCQTSSRERQSAWLKSMSDRAAFGLPAERSQTVRSARAISAQSMGTTSCSGFAFQIWSMERSKGSRAKCPLSCLPSPAKVVQVLACPLWSPTEASHNLQKPEARQTAVPSRTSTCPASHQGRGRPALIAPPARSVALDSSSGSERDPPAPVFRSAMTFLPSFYPT